MIGGLLFLAYVLMRFLYNDLRLGWWKWRGTRDPRWRKALTRAGRQARDQPWEIGDLRTTVAAFVRTEARRLVTGAGALTGFSVVTESALKEPLPPVFVLVSNHQSLLDIPVLASVLPPRRLKFIAKRSLKYGVPTLSKCLRYGGDALIDRPRGRLDTGQLRVLLRELRRFASLIDEGCSPVIFAEGTRSRDGEVHRFHTGGLSTVLAYQRVPVVSVAVEGGFRLRGVSGIARVGRTRYRVKLLSVHPPPGSKAELRALTAKMEDEITAQIARWRRERAGLRARRPPSGGSPHRSGSH